MVQVFSLPILSALSTMNFVKKFHYPWVSVRVLELNAMPLILHLNAVTQSYTFINCVRRSSAIAFRSSVSDSTTTISSSNRREGYIFVPFFYVISISEDWLNLHSRLPLWFQPIHLQNVVFFIHPNPSPTLLQAYFIWMNALLLIFFCIC